MRFLKEFNVSWKHQGCQKNTHRKKTLIACDASKLAAGYVLKSKTRQMEKKTRETSKFAPVAFGTKRFGTTGQIKQTTYAKVFLAKHFVFDEFGHILCGIKKSKTVNTKNKALKRFLSGQTNTPIAPDIL